MLPWEETSHFTFSKSLPTNAMLLPLLLKNLINLLRTVALALVLEMDLRETSVEVKATTITLLKMILQTLERKLKTSTGAAFDSLRYSILHSCSLIL